MKTTNNHRKIIDNLIEMKDVVVPILGDDIFYVSSDGQSQKSIHEYLLDCFLDEYGDRDMTDEDKAVIIKGYYYGLSKLERFFPTDFETDYRCYIRNARKNGWIKMRETVKEFIETFQFPLIITTTPFEIIENLISTVRYSSCAYTPKGSNSEELDKYLPMIYHIFGTISDGGQWVFDEDKLLEFLHSLHNNDTTSKGLKQYIDSKNCRLLVIGCNLPDWLFRFLWYPLKCGSIDSKQKKGYWISSRENSESFNDFLDNIKFYTAQEVNDILLSAVTKLKETEDVNNVSDSNETYHFDGFLSYASEDKLIAKKIYDLLTKKGYKIWFDKDGGGKIEVGSNYMKRIVAGIKSSTYYIPLVTGNFIQKVCNTESNLKKELDLVREHYSTFVSSPERYSIPILLEGSKLVNGEIITSSLVEKMTQFFLPKQLFWHINMYSFSLTDTVIDLTL